MLDKFVESLDRMIEVFNENLEWKENLTFCFQFYWRDKWVRWDEYPDWYIRSFMSSKWMTYYDEATVMKVFEKNFNEYE